jgi:tetratricopeptide (TPR) repeat protein
MIDAGIPYAVQQLNAFPSLRDSVAVGLRRQLELITSSTAAAQGWKAAFDELDRLVQAQSGGLVLLEGPPGSGVTTLLALYTLRRPAAFWFGDYDAGLGHLALYAQLCAMHQTNIPLVPPMLFSNPVPLHTLFTTVAADAATPQVIVIDPAAFPDPQPDPLDWLPRRVPEGIVLLCGRHTQQQWPALPQATAHLQLHSDSFATDTAVRMLATLGLTDDQQAALLAAGQGNWLYLRLAAQMLRTGALDLPSLPYDLAGLHRHWWDSLNERERHLAALLATSTEALPHSLISALLEDRCESSLAHWAALGLIRRRNDESGTSLLWRHWYSPAFLREQHPRAVTAAHARLAEVAQTLGLTAGNWNIQAGHDPLRQDRAALDYLIHSYARHAALGPAERAARNLAPLGRHDWIRAHQHWQHTLSSAARDLAWELRQARRSGPLQRLIRSAALCGTVNSRARSLSIEAAIAALPSAQHQHGREAGLRRIVDLIEQLPDGIEKAQALRQIGETCYNSGMRTSAMRLLSRALDLEAQAESRSWRDQREQVQVALAGTVLQLAAVDTALEISARISHIERRGLTETQIVRWLIEQRDFERAESVARTIAHESHGAWARSEVVVALARAGRQDAAGALLGAVDTETARAWALIQLACDAAAGNEQQARAWIDDLNNPGQHDRGLASLSHALALASKDGDALAAAEQITDVEVRIMALLDLRLHLDGLVAMLALEQATTAIDNLAGEARVPLLADLAAAHAALGRRERAMQIAGQLHAGEERDRAHARVAVAFARQGDFSQAREITDALGDDDERDWALDELCHLLEQSGRWSEAEALARDIRADDQRARTLADLLIARARHDDPLIALRHVIHIDDHAERVRAMMMITPRLIAAGHTWAALAVSGVHTDSGTVEAEVTRAFDLMTPAESSRHLAIIATALAHQGHFQSAHDLIAQIERPTDRSRACLAIAQTHAHDPVRAFTALGMACEIALLGRAEILRIIELATPTLARLGGAPLLAAIAVDLAEIDTW